MTPAIKLINGMLARVFAHGQAAPRPTKKKRKTRKRELKK